MGGGAIAVQKSRCREQKCPFTNRLRISANVTDDFGNVTGLEPVLELREKDCRFERNLAGLRAPGWSS